MLGSRYKQGSCQETADGFEIRTDGFKTDGGETDCKMLRVTHMSDGEYLVRARCTTEEDAPRNKNFLMSIDRNELLMR